MSASMGPELAHRLSGCSQAWRVLRGKVFKHRTIEMQTALVFLDSLVCSGRLFQSSTWDYLTQAQHNQLQDGLLRYYRAIARLPRADDTAMPSKFVLARVGRPPLDAL
eukprot:4112858-Pyramimonas_sp.AAC.1